MTSYSNNRSLNCKNCNVSFTPSTTKETLYCSKACRLEFFKPKKIILEVRKCEYCHKEYMPTKTKQLTCGGTCTKQLSNLKHKLKKQEATIQTVSESSPLPVCKICGWMSKALHTHLRTHDITVEEYKLKFNASHSDVYHSSYLEKLSERISGENNPGFNHGGEMSSFSKRNKKYEGLDDSTKKQLISDQILKANKTKKENDGYNTTLDFYIKRGLTREEAVLARSERQSTFSLEKCKERYGEQEGYEVWLDRQQKWLTSLSEIEDQEGLKEKRINNLHQTFSFVSTQIFKELLTDFPHAKCGENEAVIKTKVGVFRPDFLVDNKIIEFYGDLWHASPKKYKATDTPLAVFSSNKQFTAEEMWQKDEQRISALNEQGYEVLVIWEHEYKTDKEGIKQKCLQFLKE